jgi:glutathione synthase/RimK-type ligase-like ATP-grasp enzyme
MRIAYLNGRSWRKEPLPPGELPAPEAEDFALVAAAGQAAGLCFEHAYWDDPTLADRGYDALLIRSCWDYVDRLEAFLKTMESLAARGCKVVNPPSVLRWNAHKTYLRDLAAAGVPCIDTLWLDRLDPHAVARGFETFDAAEIVLKPQIGSGSRDTIRLKRNAWSEGDLIAGPRSEAMLQPFLASLETEGEISLFFCFGHCTHAIRKRPAPGEWRANLMDAVITPHDPTTAQKDTASAALAAAPSGLAYARVDLVLAGGTWRVIELELIEPRLYFAYAPSAAALFVSAFGAGLAA